MGKRIACLLIAGSILFGAAIAHATYATDLRSATRNHRLFSFETWDAKLMWRGTFFSDDFRKSFTAKHIKVNHLDDAESESYIAEQVRRQEKGWDFFIILYTKKEYKMFTNDPDSFWKIRLTTGAGDEIKPVSVESIPLSPYTKVMFPKVNRWSKTYRVTFPKVDLGDKFELTLESVIGESTLSWKVR